MNDQGTTVCRRKLLDAAYAVDMGAAQPAPPTDLYLTVVATAAGLPYEEIQKRFAAGDKGLTRARTLVKNLLFLRIYGVPLKSS